MKYCPHCQQWNHGRPMRCRYCGRTWYVRLCRAGHVNPINANFCGVCGQGNLSEPAERQSLFYRITIWVKRLLYLFLVSVGLMIIIDILTNKPTDTQITFLLAILILIIGVNFAMKKTGLSFQITGRSIYEAIVRFYRWVSSIRIR